ncbi:unnamed protein product [Eruca vesicaria subsp. sativa]|uniref:Uncharacterized protein n=1 Tax=Eruca vesicaria subsp. sativa TaxID=29727 RepID=A0ABC8LM20_ERUVS|nr:unnamed protein product [Eruca vesicaria subsp. sativa]
MNFVSHLNNEYGDSNLKDDTSLSQDDGSLSQSDEEYEIVDKEDQLETKGFDALEANNENEKRDNLCIGMEFSSDESAHIAYGSLSQTKEDEKNKED